MFTIELGKNKESGTCSCCGGDIQIVYGFIYKDGDAFSIYHASWNDAHPDAGIDVALDFNKSGDFEDLKNRYSVGMIINRTDDEFQFSFINPESSSWGESKLRGKMFRRDETLLHPQKSEFLRIAEHILENDPRLKDALS